MFVRWADEILHSAYPKPPEPPGLVNDPALSATSLWYGSPFNPVRWAGNNYFTSNMRNLGLMALALDPDDDPDGKLRGYLANAAPFTGFTYVVTSSTTAHWITGLAPDLGYRVNAQQVGMNHSVTISLGGKTMTDSGGLLHLTPGRQPILAATRLPNGTIRLQFIEFPGRAYTIQASRDLDQWTDLGAPIQGADGLFQFDDMTAASVPWRFYRKLAK